MELNKKGAGQGALPQQSLRLHSSLTPLEKARQVLQDAITAAGLDDFTALALMAAAESYARESIRAEFAAFVAELDQPRGVAA